MTAALAASTLDRPGRVPRVLFVAPVEPWCRENGSSVIIADLLEGVVAADRATILPLFLRRAPPGYTPRPPAGLDGVTLGVQGLPRWASIAWALIRGSSPLRMRFANNHVARLIIQTARERNFSPMLVHVEHLPLVDIGLKLARVFRCPLVYRAHNVESQLWARRLGSAGAIRRGAIRRVERLEAAAIEACQLTLCISNLDLAWARAHAPAARAELLPCSLLLNRYDAYAAQRVDPGPQICFVGGLEWAPNEMGLRWFVHEILPRITAEVPHARLAVLARGAASRPWISTNPAIEVLPPHADALSLFSSSRVSVAPLLQGGGVRIKIPESLAVGCPVVATSIGAEGLELRGLTSTDDPAEFAEACVRHLRQAGSPESLAAQRAAVEDRHGATALANRLIGLWSELVRPSLPGAARHVGNRRSLWRAADTPSPSPARWSSIRMTSMRMRQVVLRILSRLLRWLPTPMVDSLRGLRYLTALRRTSPSAEPELAVVSVLVRPGDSCVDVGANFGFYTKEMSQLVGHGGWVYSVEPIPSTHSLLVANLKRLGLDNVRTFAVAATDHDGDLQMSIPMWGYGAPNYYEAHVVTPDTAAGAVQVKGCRLDTLLADPPGVVRLVKVDVEGHELEVLKGALHVIRDHKPAWLIEVSGDPDAAGSPAAAVVHLMRNEGYGIYRFDGRLVVPRRAGDQSTNYFFLLPAHVQRLRDARLA